MIEGVPQQKNSIPAPFMREEHKTVGKIERKEKIRNDIREGLEDLRKRFSTESVNYLALHAEAKGLWEFSERIGDKELIDESVNLLGEIEKMKNETHRVNLKNIEEQDWKTFKRPKKN